MLNITDYWANANQNHNKMVLHIHQDGYYETQKKTKKLPKTLFGEDVEKPESSSIAGRDVKWGSHCGKQM